MEREMSNSVSHQLTALPGVPPIVLDRRVGAETVEVDSGRVRRQVAGPYGFLKSMGNKSMDMKRSRGVNSYSREDNNPRWAGEIDFLTPADRVPAAFGRDVQGLRHATVEGS